MICMLVLAGFLAGITIGSLATLRIVRRHGLL
jgi:hypothetical protein